MFLCSVARGRDDMCRRSVAAVWLLVAFAGAALLTGCGGGSVDSWPPRWFRPCATDEECATEPSFAGLGSFPPLCVAGMCQLTQTHRCATDDDCADIYRPPGSTIPPRCGNLYGADPRLCDTVRTEGTYCGQDGMTTCFHTACQVDVPCAPAGGDPNGYRCELRTDRVYRMSLCLPRVESDVGGL